MRGWEDLTRLEQLQSIWWDLYKDVHGFRPRGVDTDGWTEADFEAELTILEKDLVEVEKQRQDEEALAVTQLESRIQALMGYGARNRAMALRWLHEAYETNGDWEYLEWNLGIPYRYFTKKGDVA